MTDLNASRLDRINKRIDEATAALEAGFANKAAQKRASAAVSSAYDHLRDLIHGEVINAARAAVADWDKPEGGPAYFDFLNAREMPFQLNHIRDRHFEALKDFPLFAQARDLVALREAILATEIAAKPVNVRAEKVEAVRRSVIEEMEARHQNYVTGLDLSKRLGGLSVYVNAHYCYMQTGGHYVRYFFYLHGKLTALNSIIAISEKLEKEAAR